MSTFNRRFANLSDNSGNNDWTNYEGVKALFAHWYLPGTVPTNSEAPRLRIGIRDNYLNFYTEGQSVAKLRVNRAGLPVVEVHKKYKHGVVCGNPETPECAADKDYPKFTGNEITPAAVEGWIATARTYRSPEKAFVERLVAENPGVIDLEMGLPANAQNRSAPRMDVVMVQMHQGRPEIAFWEAKCSNNSELRADLDVAYSEDEEGKRLVGPHVIEQVRKYQRWLGVGSGSSDVSQAYQSAAKILVALAELFGKAECEALTLWRAAANTRPEIISSPGIVIANYDACIAGYAKEPFAKKNDSFDGHKKRLKAHGITVVPFDRNEPQVLKRLSQNEIKASLL